MLPYVMESKYLLIFTSRRKENHEVFPGCLYFVRHPHVLLDGLFKEICPVGLLRLHNCAEGS